MLGANQKIGGHRNPKENLVQTPLARLNSSHGVQKARFRDLEHCLQFMISSYVRVQGWFPYPWFSQDALQTGNEWLAGEIDMSDPGRVSRVKRWVLFRSAQFVHNRAFDEIPQLGNRVHVLEILDTVTAAFDLLHEWRSKASYHPTRGLRLISTDWMAGH